MFDSLQILNFRGFGNFRMDRLSRINLITGKNNSGKTSLLEATFLLCGPGNPELVVNANVMRGIDSVSGSALWDTLWKPLFANCDMGSAVEIRGHHESFGWLTLGITVERPDVIELPLDSATRAPTAKYVDASTLLFSFRKSSQGWVEGRIRLTNKGLEIKLPELPPPIRARLLSSRIGNLQEDASLLGQLRKRKQGHLVLEALRIVEPRLLSVEDNSASGIPMIWGDIGLSELLPLSVMGEGVTRVARLMADVIDALSFERTAQGRRYINYRDLGVQQLGSIYERLLEHDVVRDGDGVAIRPSVFARKGSGSYYTPGDLVGLIVEETMGPLVAARMDAFKAQVEQLPGEHDPARVSEVAKIRRDFDPAEKLLALKVCDPAMGSGHFLVNLVDHLADGVISAARFWPTPRNAAGPSTRSASTTGTSCGAWF